jgi:hypothetical protein
MTDAVRAEVPPEDCEVSYLIVDRGAGSGLNIWPFGKPLTTAEGVAILGGMRPPRDRLTDEANIV